MSLHVNRYDNVLCFKHQPTSGAEENLSASIKVPEPIESISDKIDEVKERKHNKRAITVGGIVTGVMLTVMLLNPRYSSKIAQKLKNRQAELVKKVNETKNSKFVNKIYDIYLQTTQAVSNGINFVNNWNPYKDIMFKNFCSKEKEFSGIKNVRIRNKVVKANNKIVKYTSKIHSGITNIFDNISKFTVKQSYKQSLKKLNKLEVFLKEKTANLTVSEKAEIEAKLKEISEIKKYFNEKTVISRIDAQKDYMSNLERDFMSKFDMFSSSLTNKWVKKGDYFVKNLYYWPEEILKTSRDKVETEGLTVVEKLIGDGKNKSGLYNDLIEIISPKLSSKDNKALEKIMQKADKSLRVANHNECVEYFDKKRDLILGSAPTDIVTATVSLAGAGIAIASADDKRQRLSRLVTGVIPALGGVGVSMAMAAALVSGGKGLIIGAAASLVLNRLGIVFDKYVLGNKQEYDEENAKVHDKHKRKKIHNKKEAKVNA